MKKIRLLKKIGVLFLLCTALAVGGCGKEDSSGISNQPAVETQAPTGDEGTGGEDKNTGAVADGAGQESAGQEIADQGAAGQESGNAGNEDSGSQGPGEEGTGSADPSQSFAEQGDPTPTEQPEEKTVADNGKMRETLTATQVAKEMGVGINLGNTMEAFWEDKGNATSHAQLIGANKPSNYETCWGARVTTQEIIDGMKAEGFQTVRIPVYWGNMMKDDKTFQIQTPLLERVKEIVDYCRWNDMYVVINMHHYDEYLIKNLSQEEALAAVETIWRQVAEYFKDYSDYLVFEGFNENVGSYRDADRLNVTATYNYANALNQTFVDTVRSTGGNNATRILIASGYWTNIDKTTNGKFLMPKDTVEDRMMISVHYIDNSPYWSNTIGGKSWKNYSNSQCKLLKTAFTDKGIPVFVGECTAMYSQEHFSKDAEYTTSSECLSHMLNLAADYGFVPVIWDTDGDFYNRGTCRLNSQTDREAVAEAAKKIAER